MHIFAHLYQIAHNIVDVMRETSVGRVIVNEIVPPEAGYINTITDGYAEVDFLGVDGHRYRSRWSVRRNFTCVFIGRIVRDKGVEELVKVTKRLHDEGLPIKLLLVGGRLIIQMLY